jgi:hypothetical protein
MTLANDIAAAVGGPFDLYGILASISKSIEQAGRFGLTDDVARTCCDLAYSRPSTLNAALPLVRLPYPKVWIENRGGLGKELIQPGRPAPLRQGVLLEAVDGNGQVGAMTLAWTHRDRDNPREVAPTVCPFCIYFDWRTDGDVRQGIRAVHDKQLAMMRQMFGDPGWLTMILEAINARFLAEHNYAFTMEAMRNTPILKRYAGDSKEVAAIREGEKHLNIGVSSHALFFMREVVQGAVQVGGFGVLKDLLDSWMADVAGEGPFAECFIAMLNSKNPCLDRKPVDLTKLNRSRAKAGRKPLLDHVETRLALSRAQARYAKAAGIDREHARQHDVRGHFKIRRSGVYWWASHVRGDPTRPVERADYEVVE